MSLIFCSQISAGAGAPQLDATQLALLKQLTHTAVSVPSVPQSLPVADPVNFQKNPSSFGVNGSSSYPSEPPRSMAQNEQRYIGYGSPEHESRNHSHFDERDTLRGRYRGGFRNRGRGDRLGRNWDTRDIWYRESERDARSPPRSYRRGRDRSRSPPRNGEKRNFKYVSPLRKLTEDLPLHSRPQDSPIGTRNESGKDEFGRDIRAVSPKSPAHLSNTPTHSPSPPPTTDPRKPPNPVSDSSTHNENSVTPIISNTYSSTASANLDTKSPELGLENFNPATFDYTSAVAWEVLGKMWQVTCGNLPSQEQLMQFVLSYGTSHDTDSSFKSQAQKVYGQDYAPPFHGRGRGVFRGRGYGNGRGVQTNRSYDEESQSTDAIVLGGGDSGNSHSDANDDQSTHMPTQQSHGSVGSGRMQKIGDKWVFVRDSTTDVS